MDQMKHFSHEHPLVLVCRQTENGKEFRCYGCQKPISEWTYNCSKCEIFLHKECANLPSKISHSIHIEHPLFLQENPIYDCFCVVCGKRCKGFTYNCLSCKLDLCVDCAFLVLQDRHIKHDSHQHLLIMVQKPARFPCNACGDRFIKDLSYICNACPFWIHKSCAELPISNKFDFHDHPLSVAYGVPSELQHYQFECEVCNKFLKAAGWLYHCSPCRYFVHVNCAKSDSKPTPSPSRPLPDPDHLIMLPWTEMSVDVIRPFIEKMLNLQIQLIQEMNHVCHEHPVILSSDWIDNQNKDEESLCDACIEPISAPYYGCAQCNFFLHLTCANLPAELQNPSHPEHNLFLKKPENDLGYWYCNRCLRSSNGFFYECEPCKFRIDVYCAILPPNIIHHAHNQHPLVRSVVVREYCNACGEAFEGPNYQCSVCDSYYLHQHCAIMPRAVKHRWEKHHLTLMYPPYTDHPAEFYCEICEEEIYPKHWLYHCPECDQSFHPSCIPRIGKDRFIKFGSSLDIEDHEHLFKSVREGRYKSVCDSCGKKLYGKKAFECGPCGIFLCFECACYTPSEPTMTETLTEAGGNGTNGCMIL